MSTPSALPAPGGNATAALMPVGTMLEEVAIDSGASTIDGDMSYVDDPFDPCSITDPRLRMPGVLDFDVENTELNMANFTAIGNRTANVAMLNQGLDPGLAGQLLSAQEQALPSEANALHTEVLDCQSEHW